MFRLQDRVRHNRYRRKLEPKHGAHDTPFPDCQQGFLDARRPYGPGFSGHTQPRKGQSRYNAAVLLSVVGFLALGFASTLTVLIVFGVGRRAGEFAISKPARETLFNALSPGEKTK
jgi:hypothetical protein